MWMVRANRVVTSSHMSRRSARCLSKRSAHRCPPLSASTSCALDRIRPSAFCTLQGLWLISRFQASGRWHARGRQSALHPFRLARSMRRIRRARMSGGAPPRHLKSHLASVAFSAWCLGHNPSLQAPRRSSAPRLARSSCFPGSIATCRPTARCRNRTPAPLISAGWVR